MLGFTVIFNLCLLDCVSAASVMQWLENVWLETCHKIKLVNLDRSVHCVCMLCLLEFRYWFSIFHSGLLVMNFIYSIYIALTSKNIGTGCINIWSIILFIYNTKCMYWKYIVVFQGPLDQRLWPRRKVWRPRWYT